MKVFILLLLVSTSALAHNGTPYLIETSVHKNIVSIKLPKIAQPISSKIDELCQYQFSSKHIFAVHCTNGKLENLTLGLPGRLPRQQVLVKINQMLIPLKVNKQQNVIIDLSKKINAFDFLSAGFNHLINGWDHIVLLILIALNYAYLKDLLVIITSFSLGHGAIIFIISAGRVPVDSQAIEFLIALSILLYARSILLKTTETINKPILPLASQNVFWLFIGVIHGAGLAGNLFGSNELTFTQVFAFTIGIDIAQFIVILMFLIFIHTTKYVFNNISEYIKASFCYLSIVLSTIKTVELFI